MTALKILTNAGVGQLVPIDIPVQLTSMDYSHANEIHVSPFIVRGMERTMETTMPTTLKTTEQVP